MSPFVPTSTVRRGDRFLAASVLLFLLGIYTATFTGLPDNTDAEVEYQTTRALARTGRMALGDTPEAEAIIAQRYNVVEGVGERAGRYYSWFGLGQALAAVPLYWLGDGMAQIWPAIEERHGQTTSYGIPRTEYFSHLMVGWRNSFLTAFTAMLVALSARRLGAARRPAWIGGLAYGLTTFAWPQARSTLSDVQATALLFLTFHMILLLRESYREGKAPPLWMPVVLGAAAGAALLTRVLTAPALVVLAAATLGTVIVGQRGLKPFEGAAPRRPVAVLLLAGLLPALACLGVFLFANQTRFGSVFETGYNAVVLESGSFFDYPAHLGLLGLLFSPGKGILWLAPLVLLYPIGVSNVRARGESLWPWTTAGMALAVVTPVAMTGTWHGAWTFGPRYILPLLPFLWLGVALAFDDQPSGGRLRWVAWTLGGLGFVANLGGVLVDHMTHQDLAMQAAGAEWPDVDGASEAERSDARFMLIQWVPRYSAPWAHWRILRHRVAHRNLTAPETFSSRELFGVDQDVVLAPNHERERGFQHFAWVDLRVRLGGVVWPGVVLVLGLLIGGVVLAVKGLDRTLT